MILTAEEAAEGMALPRGCAPAYVDFPRRVTVGYLFPLNLIVRWTRNLWYWLNVLADHEHSLHKNPVYLMGLRHGSERDDIETVEELERLLKWRCEDIRELRDELQDWKTKAKVYEALLVGKK